MLWEEIKTFYNIVPDLKKKSRNESRMNRIRIRNKKQDPDPDF